MTNTPTLPEPATETPEPKVRLRDHIDLKLGLWIAVVAACALLLALTVWELSDDLGAGPRAAPVGLQTAVVEFEDGKTAYCVHDTFALTCWPENAPTKPVTAATKPASSD